MCLCSQSMIIQYVLTRSSNYMYSFQPGCKYTVAVRDDSNSGIKFALPSSRIMEVCVYEVCGPGWVHVKTIR